MNSHSKAIALFEKFEPRMYFSAGSLDTTFGQDGVSQLPTGYTFYSIRAIQRDGKILIAGANQLLRRRPGGGVDRTFSTNGTVTLPMGADAIAVQRDGKILIAGAIVDNDDFDDGYHLGVARLTKSGRLDKTFGKNGVYEYNKYSGSRATGMALRDGKIVVISEVDINNGQIVVLDLNGIPDASFSKDGVLPTHDSALPTEVWISKDGAITTLLSGSTIQRVTKTGAMDNRFSEDGILPLPDHDVSGAFVNGNGSLVVTGSDGRRSLLLAITNRGKIDKRIGNAGVVYPERDKRLGLNPIEASDGTRYLTGSSGIGHLLEEPRIYVAKLTSDFTLDPTFGDAGIFTVQPEIEQDLFGSALTPGADKLVFSNSSGGLLRVTLN